MKTRTILVGLGSLIITAAAWAVNAEALVANADGSSARANATKSPLEKGMTAEAIVALIGKPAEVRAIAGPEGGAEVWTYRRLLRDNVRQNAATVTMIPAFKGVNGDGSPNIGPTPELDYHLEHVRDYQVTALLIYDGKLVIGRQWTERQSHIDQ